MNITRIRTHDTRETIARLLRTRLRGHGQPLIYDSATLELVRDKEPEDLVPAQRYVLQADLDAILALEGELAPHGVDLFELEGAVEFWIETDAGEDGPIPLLPPIVEDSLDKAGNLVPLINDGMHRVSAARLRGRTINVFWAHGVPEAYPYYAWPLANGWAEVEVLESIPDDYVKKEYRDPENYKALFRDFNDVFPGVQKSRPRIGETGG